MKIQNNLFDQIEDAQIQNESNLYLAFNHENITQLIKPASQGMLHGFPPNELINVRYIVSEYINGGELFDYIAYTGKFSEQVARYFFNQFMNGLSYLHTACYVHRDIKVENLMLDSNCILKFIDFGFTARSQGDNNDGLFSDFKGTESYLAPEVRPGQQYDGIKVDIFAAGIVLFIMLLGHPPFYKANAQDPFYRYFRKNRPEDFWSVIQHNYSYNQGFVSDEFKQLFNKMVDFKPANRPNIQMIMQSSWLKGPIPKDDEIKDEFKIRLKKLEEKRIKEEEEQKQKNHPIIHDAGNNLGIGDIQIQELDNKIMKKFKKIPGKFTYKGLKMDPKLILSNIINYVTQ